jgi:prophage DNA circulation protein
MRDWRTSLAPASFRGVGFQVTSDELSEAGRHVATHEFVRSEEVLSEDMGRKARKFRVTGYVASDLADLEGQALVEACTRRGAGTLVLPWLGAVAVMCTGVRATHEKERLGYIAFDVEFVEAGSASLFPQRVLGDRLAAASAGLLAGLIFSALRASAPIRDGRVAQGITTFRALAAQTASLRTAVPVEAETGAALATDIAGAEFSSESAAEPSDLAEPARVLAEAVRTLGREADPNQVAPFMFQAAAVSSRLVSPASSPALEAISSVARLIAACFEAVFLAEAAAALASRTYPDRPTALEARAQLAALAGPALEQIARTAGEAVWRASSDAVRQALDHLARAALDLKPVVLVQTARSYPSTALAWRLYGDPARAEELVRRNRIGTSLFMPASIEALAS